MFIVTCYLQMCLLLHVTCLFLWVLFMFMCLSCCSLFLPYSLIISVTLFTCTHKCYTSWSIFMLFICLFFVETVEGGLYSNSNFTLQYPGSNTTQYYLLKTSSQEEVKLLYFGVDGACLLWEFRWGYLPFKHSMMYLCPLHLNFWTHQTFVRFFKFYVSTAFG